MGGGWSGAKASLYSKEEQAEIEEVQQLHTVGLEFVKRHLYHSVAFRGGKKSIDPTAVMWLEPQTDAVVDETLTESEALAATEVGGLEFFFSKFV